MMRFKKSTRQGSWRALGFVLALYIAGPSTSNAFTETSPPQTLDDLFSAVSGRVPEFGGMFLTENLSGSSATLPPPGVAAVLARPILQVYLTHVSLERIAAVRKAIVDVFGAEVLPVGGIVPRRGSFGFSDLREWYTRVLGEVFNIPGVTMTDIDEANNRLLIGVQKKEIEADVVQLLSKLGIPPRAAAIEVINVQAQTITTPATSDAQGNDQPASLTLDDRVRPLQGLKGGYQIHPVLPDRTHCTLGFNATATLAGGQPGFVTSSWCTFLHWQMDNTAFYQGGFRPDDVVGAEGLDPPGFASGGFPCPKHILCRYSEAAFIEYDAVVPLGVIAKTTGLTVTSAPNTNVDPTQVFGIATPPTQAYLAGLTLNKVGRRTGWTNGQIVYTCANFASPSEVTLCQYTVGNSNASDPNWQIADISDYGAPVFRLRNFSFLNFRNFSNSGRNDVELYGMLWGMLGSPPYQGFVFSPIGGVPFQRTGIQSPTDLGPLDYVNCAFAPGGPTC
jgi:hypothetical protein